MFSGVLFLGIEVMVIRLSSIGLSQQVFLAAEYLYARGKPLKFYRVNEAVWSLVGFEGLVIT